MSTDAPRLLTPGDLQEIEDHAVTGDDSLVWSLIHTLRAAWGDVAQLTQQLAIRDMLANEQGGAMERLERERDAARAALREYGRHSIICVYYKGEDRCTCGLRAALGEPT